MQNLHILKAAYLHARKASRRNPKDLSVRLAARQLRANYEAGMDWFIRRQVLEGAAGKRFGTYSNNHDLSSPSRSEDYIICDMGNHVADDFFANTSKHFKVLRQAFFSIAAGVGSYGLDPVTEFNEILFSTDGKPTFAYAVGRKYADGIQSGNDTMGKIMAGPLSYYMANKAKDVLRHAKSYKNLEYVSEESYKGEGGFGQISEPVFFEDRKMQLVWQALTDADNPYGRELREAMRSFWAAGGNKRKMKRQRVLDEYLNIILVTGKAPHQKELAEATGVDFRQVNGYMKWLTQNFPKYIRQQGLLEKIEDFLLTQGIDYTPKYAFDMDGVEARFEEGRPADPTKNMSEEDAKKWRVQNLKNRDNFKQAYRRRWR